MIAGAIQENLRFVFEPAKGAGMNDSCAVTLKLGPVGVTLLRVFAAARIAGFLRERRECRALGCLHFLARFPTFFHRAITPSIALPRRSLGEGGRLPIFRATHAPLAALASAAPADRKARATTR